MPNYPKVTGETVFAKDSLDGKIKLLDTIIQLLRTTDGDLDTAIETLSQALSTVQSTANSASSAAATAQSRADSAYSLASTANSNANSSYIMKRNQSNNPSSNNAYSLGSSSYQWSNVVARAMQIGREGYEWEINSNDGYVTFNNGIIFEWKFVSSNNQEDINYVWDLTKHFPNAWFLAQGLKMENSSYADYVHGNVKNRNSRTSITFALNGNASWQLFAFGY